MSNGWGPAEKNLSNGEQAAGDGRSITIRGVKYAKGLGTHAPSDIRYNLNSLCSNFASDIGVDGESGSAGSVTFQLFADGVKLYQSGTMTPNTATGSVNVSIAGKKQLQLVVTDSGDGNAFDHADWANARITCSAADTVAPTVTSKSPSAGSTGVLTSGAVIATFSEALSAASVSGASFSLAAQGVQTAATVSYDATRQSAVLTPNSPLLSGVAYTATLKGGSAGIKDVAGNALASDQTWTFTTAATAGVPQNLSSLPWTSATNAWGPVERNSSNGEQAAGDGKPIAINGVVYASGLGMHAPADVRYNLARACTAFTAVVGVDGEVAAAGSVVFEVWTDGVRRYQSPTLKGGTAGVPVNVSLVGDAELQLVVTDSGDGNAFDHADWADAKVTCGPDITPPTVTSITPASGTQVSATSSITATFSESIQAATCSGSTIYVTPQGSSTPVPATVSYDANTFISKVTPSAPLTAGTTYTATIRGGGSGVKDIAGNALASDKTWTFSVANAATTQPLVIDGQSNVVISGVKISNPNGPCITIQGNSQNITIQNSEVGPCLGSGVSVSSSSNVTINSVYIHDTIDNGITASSVSGLNITNNRIERIKSGVYALSSSGVVISKNTFLNVQGPFPRGQFVQFDKVSGAGNRISCNVGENVVGQSYAEDAINLYQSNGVPSDPILVANNKIKGGGPSASGGGIMMGDSGGSYQTAQNNILVDSGQYGASVASGTNMTVSNNSIFARQQSFTNVGLSVWNQYPTACSSVTVQGNAVNWTNSAGQQNSSWDGGGCGTVTGWSANTWNAPIAASSFDQPISACQ